MDGKFWMREIISFKKFPRIDKPSGAGWPMYFPGVLTLPPFIWPIQYRGLNPNWHEGWYFHLHAFFGSDLSAEFFSKISKLFYKVRSN